MRVGIRLATQGGKHLSVEAVPESKRTAGVSEVRSEARSVPISLVAGKNVGETAMPCYPLTALSRLAYSDGRQNMLKRPARGGPEMFQAGSVGSPSTLSLAALGVGEGVCVFVGPFRAGGARDRGLIQAQKGRTSWAQSQPWPSGTDWSLQRRLGYLEDAGE